MTTSLPRFALLAAACLASTAAAQCPPATPTGVNASNGLYCNGVQVTWSPVPEAGWYEIWRSQTQSSVGEMVFTTSAEEWLDQNAAQGTHFWYRIRAVRLLCLPPNNVSFYSGANEGWRGGLANAPQNVQASDGALCSAVKVTWNPSTGTATSYKVERSLTSNFANYTIVGSTTTETTLTDPMSGFELGQVFYYRVQAFGPCGTGGPSAPDTGFAGQPVVSEPSPSYVAALPGAVAEFEVVVNPPGVPVAYQWRHNGVPLSNGGSISGATTDSLMIHPVGPAHAGEYDVVVSGTCAPATSPAAVLIVNCYPDCNASGSLTVADFGCFQTKFVAQDPYADCNQSGSHTVADFGCFQTKFVAGCP